MNSAIGAAALACPRELLALTSAPGGKIALATYLHLQQQQQDARGGPLAVKTLDLAKQVGSGEHDVRGAINWLTAHGWVTRFRPDSDGRTGNRPYCYQVWLRPNRRGPVVLPGAPIGRLERRAA